jgi:hypothetical protein
MSAMRSECTRHGSPLHADFGVEKSVSVNGASASDVATKLQDLIKHGESLPK